MNKIKTPILIVAGLLTALLFGLGDIMQYLRNDPNAGGPGAQSELKREIASKIRVQAMLYNQSISGDEFDRYLSDYTSRYEKARKEGVGVGNKEIQDEIIEQFKSNENYNRFIEAYARRGVTKELFEDMLRDQLTFRKSMELETVGNYVTQSEIKADFHENFDELTFDLFRVQAEQMKVAETVTEEEKKKYYDIHFNEVAFSVPQKAVVELLHVDATKIALSTPSGSELRQYYQDLRNRQTRNQDQRQPMEYQLPYSEEFPNEFKPFHQMTDQLTEMLMAETRENKAKAVLNLLDFELLEQEKPDFAGTLAKLKKSSNNGDFNLVQLVKTAAFDERTAEIAPLEYPDILKNRVFGPKVQDYGGVLKAGGGYFLYHVLERIPKRTLKLEECGELVVQGHLREARLAKAKALAEEWLPKLKESADWSKLQAPAGASIKRLVSKDVLEDYDALDKARTLKTGEMSAAFASTGTPGYVVVRLAERKPADEKALEGEREAITNKLRGRKSQAIFAFAKVLQP